MTDQFAWWKAALADPSKIGSPELPLHEADLPHSGYYRTKPSLKAREAGNARQKPIGIWRDKDDTLVVHIDGTPYKGDAVQLFTNCCRQPIRFKVKEGEEVKPNYTDAINGKPWPDEPPAIQRDTPVARDFDQSDPAGRDHPDDGARHGVGGNQPPDPYDEKVAALAEERFQVELFLKKPITSQEECDKAANWAGRIVGLKKFFADEYEAKNRPLLDQQADLRERFLHKSQEANALAKRLTDHQTPFLAAEREKLRKQQEVERLAAETQRLAELKQVEQQQGVEAALEQAAQAPPSAPPAEPPRVKAGTTGGRSTSLRDTKAAKVTDYRLFSAFLIAGGIEGAPNDSCSNPDLRETLDKIARKIVGAGGTAPGVTEVTTTKARR